MHKPSIKLKDVILKKNSKQKFHSALLERKRKLLGEGKNEQPAFSGEQPPHTPKKAGSPYFDALTLSVLSQRKAQH